MSSTGITNDVYCTSQTDGNGWSQVTAAAAFPKRFAAALVTVRNMFVLAGGKYSSTYYVNDVYLSSNAVNWIQITAAGPFEPLSYISAMVMGNTMILAGGAGNGTSVSQQVWGISIDSLCTCTFGWGGINCAVPFDDCTTSPCRNGGTCTTNTTTYTYRCLCTSGYTGVNCTQVVDIDPCATNECMNGGTCKNCRSDSFDGYRSFNGTSYYELNNAGFSMNDAFTYCYWMYRVRTGTYDFIFSYGSVLSNNQFLHVG